MTIQLRQICLVARELEPVLQDLTQVLGIERCYVDPGVGHFGLENTLMPVGRNFLEVVAPVQQGTAAGRYLDRRGGDGGYMVICQADNLENQRAARQRALDQGIRIAHESERDTWNICQLHPRDMVSAFLEIDWDEQNDFQGNWMPAGGKGWEDKVKQDRTVDYLGVYLQSEHPESLADLWARVVDAPVEAGDRGPRVGLANAWLEFTAISDDRGAGLEGIALSVRDNARIRAEAEARGLPIAGDRIEICGTGFYLDRA